MFIPKGWHCFAVASVFINYRYFGKNQQQTTTSQSRYFLIYTLFLTKDRNFSSFPQICKAGDVCLMTSIRNYKLNQT